MALARWKNLCIDASVLGSFWGTILGLAIEQFDDGAALLLPAEESGFPWSVLADPEGGEFCAFASRHEG